MTALALGAAPTRSPYTFDRSKVLVVYNSSLSWAERFTDWYIAQWGLGGLKYGFAFGTSWLADNSDGIAFSPYTSEIIARQSAWDQFLGPLADYCETHDVQCILTGPGTPLRIYLPIEASTAGMIADWTTSQMMACSLNNWLQGLRMFKTFPYDGNSPLPPVQIATYSHGPPLVYTGNYGLPKPKTGTIDGVAGQTAYPLSIVQRIASGIQVSTDMTVAGATQTVNCYTDSDEGGLRPGQPSNFYWLSDPTTQRQLMLGGRIGRPAEQGTGTGTGVKPETEAECYAVVQRAVANQHSLQRFIDDQIPVLVGAMERVHNNITAAEAGAAYEYLSSIGLNASYYHSDQMTGSAGAGELAFIAATIPASGKICTVNATVSPPTVTPATTLLPCAMDVGGALMNSLPNQLTDFWSPTEGGWCYVATSNGIWSAIRMTLLGGVGGLGSVIEPTATHVPSTFSVTDCALRGLTLTEIQYSATAENAQGYANMLIPHAIVAVGDPLFAPFGGDDALDSGIENDSATAYGGRQHTDQRTGFKVRPHALLADWNGTLTLHPEGRHPLEQMRSRALEKGSGSPSPEQTDTFIGTPVDPSTL